MTNSRVRFLIFIAAIILFLGLGKFFHLNDETIQQALKGFPFFWAGVIFVIAYVLVTFFFWFSKDVFRIAAAILFGAYLSTLFVFLAESLNAVILFSLARALGKDFVETNLSKRFSGLYQKLSRVNYFWLLGFRGAPFIPLRFLDLSAGLTTMSLRRYMSVVILATPLRIFWVQFILAGVGKSIYTRPEAVANYLIANKGIFVLTFVYLILIILVAFKIKKD